MKKLLALLLVLCMLLPAAASALADGQEAAAGFFDDMDEYDEEESYYVIGSDEDTFAGLYKRMCVNLDLKENPIPEPEEDMGEMGSETLYATVLKDDDESYEFIGFCRTPDGKDRYICWSWTGIHEDGSVIGMLVFYTADGKYLGNIQRDLSAGTSTSSHNCPYFVPGEPINKK